MYLMTSLKGTTSITLNRAESSDPRFTQIKVANPRILAYMYVNQTIYQGKLIQPGNIDLLSKKSRLKDK